MSSTYSLKEVNGLVMDIIDTLVRMNPKNKELAMASTEARMMMRINPEALHTLMYTFVIAPHSAKIAVADDSFVDDMRMKRGGGGPSGDPIGLSDCYGTLSVEDKAMVLYSLSRLSVMLKG